MTNLDNADTYYQNVIKRWGEASWSFKDACDKANQQTFMGRLWLLEKDGTIKTEGIPWSIIANKVEIDGNGNKSRIYCNQFEHIIQALEKWEISGDVAREQATELWVRLLLDLAAMNADDLRKWEIAVWLTNIIDINNLEGVRGHIFEDTMKEAMKKVISKIDIPITAWETAVLWQNEEARKIQIAATTTIAKIKDILSSWDNDQWKKILELFEILNNKFNTINKWISFNIGGTALGYNAGKKLVDIESQDRRWIVIFEEQSEDGIIGPRANGITKIIEDMTDIMGEWREDKTFEVFVEKIGEEKAALIPEDVTKVCAGKKMRDIATGTTTVFNPFISRTLLGWFDGEPIVKIAKIIHVTGGPLDKRATGISDNYRAEINMGDITSPQIVTLSQIAKDIPDKVVANKFNMGAPVAIICHEDDIDAIIKKAEAIGITAKHRWTVHKKTDENQTNIIRWVGLNNSDINF